MSVVERGFQGFVGQYRHLSVALLVVSNVIPLIGVFAWGWDVAAILILYWSENLILGFLTIVKMIVNSPIGGIFSSAFFLVHYGGFCGMHGFFVLAMTVGDMGDPVGGDPWPLWLVFVQILVNVVEQVLAIAPAEWIIAFAALFVSHTLSLITNYFGRGEYRDQTTNSLMMAPYKRMVVLHVAIIFGGWGVMLLGSPVWLLIVLIALKIGIDVHTHLKEHEILKDTPAGESA